VAAVEFIERSEGPTAGEPDQLIEMTTQIAATSGEPFVIMRWGSQAGRFSPDDARQHAYKILEAANSAETDAFLIHFLAEKVGLGREICAPVLRDFRTFREFLAAKSPRPLPPTPPANEPPPRT